jgi:hypothetical protein
MICKTKLVFLKRAGKIMPAEKKIPKLWDSQKNIQLGVVVFVCNPSYLEGRRRRIMSSRPTEVKN